MRRRPPRSTRTDTLFPYTTLFRSSKCPVKVKGPINLALDGMDVEGWTAVALKQIIAWIGMILRYLQSPGRENVGSSIGQARSEERRVGKECVSTCRSRWSPYRYKKYKASNSLSSTQYTQKPKTGE